MKIAILADTHFGVRQDSEVFHDNMMLFYNNIFFPELVKRNIKHIIHVGDVFDSRKKIDMHTARRAREYFFTPLEENGIVMDIIAGNHDLYFRHRSDTTALKEILGLYKNLIMCTDVRDVKIGNKQFCFVPWIHNTNRDVSLQAIRESKAEIAFGHLELTGYQMYKGQISKHGEDPTLFEHFQHVYSGHFHHKNSRSNITYLGSVSQHIWTDYGDTRGCHIFDTDTYEMEFIANPYNMFEIIQYSDDCDDLTIDVKGKYVRVTHSEVQSQSKLDTFNKKIIEAGAADLKVVPRASYNIKQSNSAITEDSNIEVEDALTLIKSCVPDNRIYSKLEELYNKAQLCI